ncbi:MAG: hypothetical protein GXP40_13250 [Chloroflexi bacterium]|nr:hypothetical protein [Chloroflexota bacterium]
MKKILFLLFAVVLSACGAVAPVQPTAAPPVVITVLVPVEVTQPPPPASPTAIPTEPPAPTPTQEMPAAVPTNTPEPEVLPTATAQSGVGGTVFTNVSRSADKFSLNCLPTEITFSLTSVDPYITEVDLYYRMEDQLSGEISTWSNAGKMEPDGNGNYSIVFTALDVNPDLRYENGWLDYQFVGTNKYGDVVGRSQKIVKEVVFTRHCP